MPRNKSRQKNNKNSNRSYTRANRSTAKALRSRESRSRKMSKLREVDPILINANNPLYTSCKYFAANEYFKYLGYSGKTLEDKVYYMIDGKDGLSENNRLPIFEPNGAEALPGGLTLCFITYLPGFSYESPKNSTPIIHGFLLLKHLKAISYTVVGGALDQHLQKNTKNILKNRIVMVKLQ